MSFHITNQTIKKEWTDYNNHMNMAYYVLVFDQTWEIILEKFKMGEKSAKNTQRSTMVVETHTTYDGEVKEGDEVEIVLTFFDTTYDDGTSVVPSNANGLTSLLIAEPKSQTVWVIKFPASASVLAEK